MKRLLLSIATLLMLAGCNFDAPLTEKPTRDIDPSLLGSWFSLSDGKPLDVYKLSKDEYLVVDDGSPFVCTHSDIAGTGFVNCKLIGNDKEHYGKYAYIAYKIEDGNLVLTPLSGSLPLTDKSTAKDVRAALEEAVPKGTALDTDPNHQTRYKKKP